jgi:hypothetical protein
MADYSLLIAKAVSGLEKNTGEARRALYHRAREVLVASLRGFSEPDITRERLALEQAIATVELEAAGKHRDEDAIPMVHTTQDEVSDGHREAAHGSDCFNDADAIEEDGNPATAAEGEELQRHEEEEIKRKADEERYEREEEARRKAEEERKHTALRDAIASLSDTLKF